MNGSTAVFTYEGKKLLTEQSGNITKTNIYGTNLIATAGTDELYYQYNNHGDVISVLDQAGEVKNEYDYDAFGNAITEKETVSNPYRYAGYYQDSESGLYYLQSRYYNPRTARFLTEDTASGKYTDPLSLNKHTYCHNQPVTGYDPDGHFLHIVAGAAIGALVSGGLSYASQAIKNKSFTKGINWQKVAGSAAEGAIIGGVGAATGGAGLAASAAGTAAKTGAKTVAKTTAKAVAKKVAINVAGNAAGNVANQAISKGVKKISAKEAAVAGATGILDVAGNAAGTALKKAGSKAVRKIAGAAAEGAGAIAAKKAGAKAAQKALGTSAEAGLAGAGKNAVSSQQGLGKKLLDGIDNLKSTGKALLKDEGGFLDLDALAGKKSVSGAVGKSGTSSTTAGFDDWLGKGATDNKVYFGMKDGTAQYTGITKQTKNARLNQHNNAGKGFDDLDIQYEGLTRNQARAIEQYYIENGPNALNKINSISPNNKYYQDAMNWAKQY